MKWCRMSGKIKNKLTEPPLHCSPPQNERACLFSIARAYDVACHRVHIGEDHTITLESLVFRCQREAIEAFHVSSAFLTLRKSECL